MNENRFEVEIDYEGEIESEIQVTITFLEAVNKLIKKYAMPEETELKLREVRDLTIKEISELQEKQQRVAKTQEK